MAQLLVDELIAHRVRISEEGDDSYGNGRDAPNDDLVLATAFAPYVATRRVGARMTHTGLERELAPEDRRIPHFVIAQDMFSWAPTEPQNAPDLWSRVR